MTNEEQLESLEREWKSLMNQVNEVERKIVQLRGIISKEAAQQKRVPDANGRAEVEEDLPEFGTGGWLSAR